MKATITGIVRCHDLRFKIEPGKVAAIIGRNEVGKSSAAMAVRACLTRNDNPAGLSIPMMKHYINDDATDATAVIEVNDKNFVMWNAGKRAIREVGNKTPVGNKGALAGVDFCALGGKGRTDYWESVLGIGTNVKLLEADLLPLLTRWRGGDEKLAARDFQGISALIKEDGFEQAEKSYRATARRLKAQWGEIVARTGERKTWGAAIGREWFPDGWSAKVEAEPLAALKRGIEERREKIKSLQAAEVVVRITEEEMSVEQGRLKVKQDQAADLDAGLENEKREVRGMEKALTKCRDHLNACQDQVNGARIMLERERDKEILICPHCDKEVRLDGDPPKLVKDVGLSHHEAEMKKLENMLEECKGNRDEAQEQLMRIKEEHDMARSKHDKVDFELHSLRRSISDIEDWIEKHKNKLERVADTPDEDVRDMAAELESQIERLQRSILIKEAYAQAKDIHAEIVLNENIAYRLSPKGFRAEQMQKGIVAINKVVEKICEGNEWLKLKVGKDLSLSWGERPVQLASKSAQWRVNAILTCAVAWFSKAKVVMFDGGDILDSQNYQSFVNFVKEKMAEKMGMAVIWCATGQDGHLKVFKAAKIKPTIIVD